MVLPALVLAFSLFITISTPAKTSSLLSQGNALPYLFILHISRPIVFYEEERDTGPLFLRTSGTTERAFGVGLLPAQSQKPCFKPTISFKRWGKLEFPLWLSGHKPT